jgi:uncharacterized protein (DUF488 family)
MREAMAKSTTSQPELPLAAAEHRGAAVTKSDARPVLTIGHSTRSSDEMVALLAQHGAGLVADVRAFPRSRRNAQFNIDSFPAVLADAGIGYRHFPGLGGRRKPRAESANAAWREPGFRGFADYMESLEFAEALAELLSLAGRQSVALMCAEAQPWRCHRSLISDALVARGVAVEHIMGTERRRPHRLPPFARVVGESVSYPALLTE